MSGFRKGRYIQKWDGHNYEAKDFVHDDYLVSSESEMFHSSTAYYHAKDNSFAGPGGVAKHLMYASGHGILVDNSFNSAGKSGSK